jgi:hypothetical protein
VKRTLQLLACRKCSAPVIQAKDAIVVRCDLPAMSPEEEALAWLAGRPTYSIASVGAEQHLIRRFCTRETAREAVALIAAGTRPDLTVLAAHRCPGAEQRDPSLRDWRPRDRRAFLPSPRTPPPEEPQF